VRGPSGHWAIEDGHGGGRAWGRRGWGRPRDPPRPQEAGDYRRVRRRALLGHFVEQLEGGEHGVTGELVLVGFFIEQVEAIASSEERMRIRARRHRSDQGQQCSGQGIARQCWS